MRIKILSYCLPEFTKKSLLHMSGSSFPMHTLIDEAKKTEHKVSNNKKKLSTIFEIADIEVC